MINQLFKPAAEQTSRIRIILRIGLGVFLIFTGISHLTFQRVEFLAQVPNWVPLDGDLVVVLSGLVEIILGAALVFIPRFRVFVGWMTAAFFVVVFPGNIAQYLNGTDAFGLNTDRARFIRLFFQPPLVLWALWSTGTWRTLQSMRQANVSRTH